jgi:cell division protein FtsQ
VNWRAVLLPPLVVAAAIATVAVGKQLLDRPVQRLTIEAPFQRVTSVQIEGVVGSEVGQGFLSVDLDLLSERLRALDWVEDARVWRRWPDTLVVRISEHTAAARWGDTGLLNTRGELFTEDAHHSYPELPSLAGPVGTERRVAELYLAVRGRLAEAHLTLEALHMDDRGAVSFTLSSGQEVRIGREDVIARLDRFFDVVAPALDDELPQVKYVDLRYANGFAVGWHDASRTQLAQNKESPTRG